MLKKSELGKKGEEAAVEFLVKKGYLIHHKNWRFKHKEIDIIAEINNTLVIVEVKSRKDEFYEDLAEAVSYKKQKYLIDAAEAYIFKYNIDIETRFDIIAVVFYKNTMKIEHVEDAFYPTIKKY
jgi:putative endonuclease